MSARRFFVEGARAVGEVVAIGERDAHKISHVLRLRGGDAIEIVDEAGRAFDARVRGDAAAVSAELVAERKASAAAPLRIDIAQGIPKGAKMDFVIEKATELGAASIVPLYSERSIVQDIGASKLERWRRLAKTAASQSDRRDIPEVTDPVRFDALLERFDLYDLVLMPWERAGREPLRARLPYLLEGAHRVLVVVGPEGGFADAEAERASGRGARMVWLGDRVLRSETAALAVLSVLSYVSDGHRPGQPQPIIGRNG
jgi:16S rRNA (uracil1498-N3)-methyltransferase